LRYSSFFFLYPIVKLKNQFEAAILFCNTVCMLWLAQICLIIRLNFRLHNNLPDETQLPNGQKFELLSLALLGVPSMAEKFMEVSLAHDRVKIFSGC
jgi:hypothetical protein